MVIKQLEITTKTTKYHFPLDRYYYTQDPGHIWFKPVQNKYFEVGYDDFGQQQGPILHIRTRASGKEYPQGKAFGTVETNKFIGPQRLPLTAILIETNKSVLEKPGLINENPYFHWVVRIQPTKFEDEINSPDIIAIGDKTKLREYIISEVERYEDSVT